MTYATSGIHYDILDPFKRQAQEAAKETTRNLEKNGAQEVEWTRGESVYLIETPERYLAHVEEGLGTKNLVADALYPLTDKTYYDYMAQDTVAMIVNDMITVGALPLSIAMHLAAGSSEWFKDEQRTNDVLQGWKKGCNEARCTWAGGETPTLKDVINPETVVLSGSALGNISPKENIIKPSIQDGDAIVLLRSSGIHANGLTLARRIAEKLPRGYLAPLPDGKTYGEAIVQPTTIYVPIIADCLSQNVEIHYAVNITGHGWRKLMRAVEPFVYRITDPGKPQPLFQFMQNHGPVSDYEAYSTFNMGAGFALYVPPGQVQRVLSIASKNKITAWEGGRIEKCGTEKKVIIVPKGIEYAQESLGVR